MMNRCFLLCIFALVMSDDKARAAAHLTLTAFLEKKRLRKTSERFFILDKVMSMTGPFGADALMEAIGNDAYLVSRATVYNTLSLLTECGLIRRIPHTGTRLRYERVACISNRFQLICSQCGKIKEVKDAELIQQINARRYSTFHPSEFTLTIYGICSRCMRQNKKDKLIQ